MHVTDIIPYKVWVNAKAGRKASIYGACPWYSEAEKTDWKLETRGYTWQMSNGSVGMCRVPAKTYGEAVDIANRMNALSPGAPRFDDETADVSAAA